jgi:hypothetical protein
MFHDNEDAFRNVRLEENVEIGRENLCAKIKSIRKYNLQKMSRSQENIR